MSISQQTLETLEFTKVREKLAHYTSFSASRELALALLPSTDMEDVSCRLKRTSEARLFLHTYPSATIGGAHDIRSLALRAARGGVLEPTHFLDISSTLVSMRQLRAILLKLNRDTFPLLTASVASLPELLVIENEIERTVDDNATILDRASATLDRLRHAIRTASARLQERLQHLVSTSQSAGILQEAIITIRNGRYVIPVKTTHRRVIPGLVHDQSASGSTLYIEPMVIVEMNNHLRELQLAEEQEVLRILSELSALVGRAADTLVVGVETLALLDLAFAQAKYAEVLRCTEPIVTCIEYAQHPTAEDSCAEYPLHLLEARHPLLDQQTVVPIDVWMGKAFRLLIITGPNTGGKSVALKTIGLLALMSQAGLHIPASSPSRMPLFRQIFADIGDEQSIEQSLSTFSSHMKTIIHMLQEIEQSDGAAILVLLDEIGAGTDPVEGAALARAIIERFLERNCLGIVTTHYADLKVFAHNTPGVQNASVEFDEQTLAPTYRLTIGLPGRSRALAIAARLGLDPALVQRSQSTMNQDSLRIEDLLGEIHKKHELATEELQRTGALREDAEKYRDRLALEYKAFEESRQHYMQNAMREIDDELRHVRHELRRLRQEIQNESQSLQRIQEHEQSLQHIHAHVQQIVQKQVSPILPNQKCGEIFRPFRKGDTVWISSIGMSGEIVVVDEDDQTADVQVGGFRVHAELHELRHEEDKAEEKHYERHHSVRAIVLPDSPDVSMTLDMRGWRASEVSERLERYLNDAYLSALPEVRLIHGKGSGALRKVVREMLYGHPLVKTFDHGGKDGGDGATVVKLIER